MPARHTTSSASRPEDRLSRVLDGSHEAFVAMDESGAVTDWNRAAELLFGWTREEVAGRRLGDVIVPPDDRAAHAAGLARFLASGRQRVIGRRLELSALRRDGTLVPVELTISCLHVDGAWAFHGFLHDISARREAAAQADLLAQLVRSSGAAMYAMDLDGRLSSWNGAAEALFGFRAQEVLGRSVEVIVPPDRTQESLAIAHAVLSEGATLHAETRRRRKDGAIVDVALTVSPIRDGTGVVIGRSAIARDITAAKRADGELATARQQFERAFEDAPIGMAMVDLGGRFMQVNRALRAFIDHDDAFLTGRHVSGLSHPDDLDRHLEVLRSVRDGAERAVRYEARLLAAGGAMRWAAIGVSVIRDETGDPLHYVAHVLDVTAAKTHEQQLASYTGQVKERTRQDPVTGLPARPAFDADVHGRLSSGEPCTVLLLGAANLEDLSDRRGAVAADTTLCTVAAQVTAASREADEAYRIDAATVALVLAGTRRADARRAGERIRRRVTAVDPEIRLIVHVLALPEDRLRLQETLEPSRRREKGHGAGAPAPRSASAARSADLSPRTSGHVASMLAAARAHLGMDVSWLSEFTDGQQVFRALDGDNESFGLTEGDGLPLSGSFCVRVLDGRLPPLIPDSSANAITRRLEVTRDAGIGSYAGAPVRLADGHVYGMLCAVGHDARPELNERDVVVLEMLAELIAERIDHDRDQARRRRSDIEDAGVTALLAALDARDHYTGDHSAAVVALSGATARSLGLSAAAVQEVEQVALLHDIGKVGIPDSVLHKAGPLNELEWELMRQHSALGGRIVASIASLAHLAPAVRAEHERWDGGGYPDGLAGRAIPIASRIVLAADAYHAMTSDRPYRSAMSVDAAVAELRACAGTQFDPDVTSALAALVVPAAVGTTSAPATDASPGRLVDVL